MKKQINAIVLFWRGLTFPLQILLGSSVLISLVLAIVGVITRSIFTYDQARDALQAYSIWHNHDIKILGPETDIPGVFHGVLWYYMLALLYGIGKIPEVVVTIFSIFSIGTIAVVGCLAQKLFQNKITTTLAIIFYALSPLFQTTTRWVSNPILAFLLTPVLLLLLWNFIHKQRAWVAFLIALCMGCIIQGEFAFILLLLAFPLYWILFRWKIRLVDIVGFVVGFFISTSSFFVAEIKFKGQAVKGAVQYLHDGSSSHTISQTISFIFGRVIDLFSISFYPFPWIFLILAILVLTIFSIRTIKSKQGKPVVFLLLWIAMLFIFLFSHTGISTSDFLFYPFLAPTILLVSFTMEKIYKKNYIFWPIVFLILFFQIYHSLFFLQTNTSPLPAQQGTTLSLAKQVIAYTYQEAHGKPFTINTVTNPLYINSTWAYFYTTYGLPKYKYLPYFAGKDQQGRLGYLPEKQFGTNIRFLIIEPPIGIPQIYILQAKKEEDMVSKVIAEKHFGDYVVQERQLE